MIGKKTVWKKWMIDHLYDNYLTHTNKQLAGRLGLKLTVVRMKLYELGLARYNQKDRAWTAEEDEQLIRLYKNAGDVEIGKILNRSKGGVRKRRITLGLKRSVSEINKIVDTNMIKFKKHTFKKGNIPRPNPVKAWQTRRERERQPVEKIIERISKSEKCNYYRLAK